MNGVPASATSSPITNTRRVAPHLLGERLVDRLAEASARGCRRPRLRRRHPRSTSLGVGIGRVERELRRPSSTSPPHVARRCRCSSASPAMPCSLEPAAQQRDRVALARATRCSSSASSGSRRGRCRRRGGRGSGRCCRAGTPGRRRARARSTAASAASRRRRARPGRRPRRPGCRRPRRAPAIVAGGRPRGSACTRCRGCSRRRR